MDNLPDDACRNILWFLDAQDIMQALSVNQQWNQLQYYYQCQSKATPPVKHFGNMDTNKDEQVNCFWNLLWDRDSNNHRTGGISKQMYLQYCQASQLRHVRWAPARRQQQQRESSRIPFRHRGGGGLAALFGMGRSTRLDVDDDDDAYEDDDDDDGSYDGTMHSRYGIASPAPREGHSLCYMSASNTVICQGGFCDDDRVHYLELSSPREKSKTNARQQDNNHLEQTGEVKRPGNQPRRRSKKWFSVLPRTTTTTAAPSGTKNNNDNNNNDNMGVRPGFVYGASLTPLADGKRAVRFGGFRGGGYSAETNDIYVLHFDLVVDDDEKNKTKCPSCTWEKIVPRTRPEDALLPAGRAYHTATLIRDRYLLFVGGMQSRGSILSECILDTHTWTWLCDVFIADPITFSGRPSGRHGHSIVLDEPRNRLVMFGGGSGADLLRSGVDNSQVWELSFDGKDYRRDLESSFPWRWKQIYTNANDDEMDSDDDDNDNNEMKDDDCQITPLSLSESLCLGRCHVAAHVTRDTVVFCFGSGRPSTNGVLAYSLKQNSFFKPTVSGPLPTPRFTAGAALIPNSFWLVLHGGYSPQDGGTLGDTILLDLCPSANRNFDALPIADQNNNRCNVASYRPIVDADVQRSRTELGVGQMLGHLMSFPSSRRRAMASEMLRDLMASGAMGGRAFIILSMIASGSAVLGDASGSDDEDADSERVVHGDEQQEDDGDEANETGNDNDEDGAEEMSVNL